MHGTYHIKVSSRYIKYEFDIRRNITIIKGDSATGKTTLVDMIGAFENLGINSGVSLSCQTDCRVIEGNRWKEQLSFCRNCIVFVDEGNEFIKTQEFAENVKGSSNYFVLVTREKLDMLPVSVDEIYGIRSSGKYGGLTPVYHEFFRIFDYREKNVAKSVVPEIIITEDSNSGFEFFSSIVREKNIECISAHGKSNIFGLLNKEDSGKEILVIADGAAFGSHMAGINEILIENPNMHLYLPESFEWMILISGVLDNSEITKMTSDPSEFADSEKYFSWEQFFTAILVEYSQDSYLKYSKSRLNVNYLNSDIRDRICDVMEGISFDLKNDCNFSELKKY